MNETSNGFVIFLPKDSLFKLSEFKFRFQILSECLLSGLWFNTMVPNVLFC